MPAISYITLASGTKVPQVAFGVGAIDKTEFSQERQDRISSAIKLGYRHFDGAEAYNTDVELGNAIKQSGVPRSEIFITHKVAPTEWENEDQPDIEKALRRSLKTLGTEYVDLYLIHNPWFPPNTLTLKEAWEQMEGVKEKGLAKEIGISNFELIDLEKLLKVAHIKPAVNQIELHPYLWEEEKATIAFCKANSIAIASYSPLLPISKHDSGPIPELLETIAPKYNKSPAQLLLKWQTQKGFVVITNTSKPERQAIQLDLDFELKEEDIRSIEESGAKCSFRFFGWGYFHEQYNSVL